MPPTPSSTLERNKRLRKRRDFLRVQKYGARSFGRFLVAIAERQHSALGRVGFTVPKKVGPAVIRNKIKRRLRHILRNNQNLFLERSLVIVARESAASASFAELYTDLVEACKKIRHQHYHRPPRAGAKNEYSLRQL